MINIYLMGNYNLLKDYDLNNLLSGIVKINTSGYKDWVGHFPSDQAMSIKLQAINSSDLVIIVLNSTYTMTHEDIFTMGYVRGLNKRVLLLGELSALQSGAFTFSDFSYLQFDDVYDMVEYLRVL